MFTDTRNNCFRIVTDEFFEFFVEASQKPLQIA